MAKVDSFFIPAESKMTITPDVFASGHLVRLLNTGVQPSDFQTIAASTVVVLGPFNEPRQYRLTLTSGSADRVVSFDGVVAQGGTEVDAVDVGFDNAASGLAATDVQAALDEIVDTFSGGGGGPVAADDVSFDPNLQGYLSSTDVQGAVDELTIISTNAQIASDAATAAVAGFTPFTTEAAQDATGAMATNGTFVNLVYNDGSNTLTPNLNATGTPSSSTFLRGDNSWVAVVGFTDEAAQDAVGAMATNSTFVNLAYNDASATLTPSLNATGTPGTTNFLRGNNTWSTIGASNLSATGSAGSTTFLRGDNTWARSINVVQGADVAASSNTTFTIDIANGEYQKITFSSNCTIAFTFPTTEVRSMCLELINAGAYTITWPAALKYAGGVAPTYTSSGKDVVVVWQNGSDVRHLAVIGLDVK